MADDKNVGHEQEQEQGSKAEYGQDPDEIPDAIPEADSPEIVRRWEESDPMEGESPTG